MNVDPKAATIAVAVGILLAVVVYIVLSAVWKVLVLGAVLAALSGAAYLVYRRFAK